MARLGSDRSAGPGNIVGQLGASDLDFERDPNALVSSQSVKIGSPSAISVKYSR